MTPDPDSGDVNSPISHQGEQTMIQPCPNPDPEWSCKGLIQVQTSLDFVVHKLAEQSEHLQTLPAMAASLGALEKRLVGNGQPGEVQRLHQRIDEQGKEIEGVKAEVNQGRGARRVTSALLTIAATLAGIGGTVAFERLFPAHERPAVVQTK